MERSRAVFTFVSAIAGQFTVYNVGLRKASTQPTQKRDRTKFKFLYFRRFSQIPIPIINNKVNTD
jgi:hypothetical protein